MVLESIVALFLFIVLILACFALALPAYVGRHMRLPAPQKRPLGVVVDGPILGPAVRIEGTRLRYFVPLTILAHLVVLAVIVMVG